MLQKEKP